MVQVLPEAPSFGALLGRGLGQGLSAGIGQASQLAMQLGVEKYKKNLRQQLINEIESGGIGSRQQDIQSQLLGQPQKGTDQQFIDALPEIERQLGRDLTPKDLNELYPRWQQLMSGGQQQQGQMQPQQDDFRKAKQYAAAGEHDLSRVAMEEAKQSRKESFAREQASEPKLLEREEKLSGLEQSGMRFDRLNQLFSPDLEDKFPPSFSVGMLTKDGELRPTAAALLSPEAQEAVKLVSDELNGAKDTFGARVTNFDVQSYMKRLPTLLNSAEGRRRVLRDLRLMNKINQMHQEGVLEVVDRFGGPGKISLSKAERIFKKEFAPQMKELREEFVNPDKKSFSDLPDPGLYSGRRAVDEETGQKFRSNGKEWIPE